MKKIILALVAIIMISCNDKENKKPVKKLTTMDDYKNMAIEQGNDYAYGSYLEYCENKNLPLEKLSLSLIMNHKHKNIRSYHFIYVHMVELYNNGKCKAAYLNNMDSINRNFAIHYLKEGAKRDDISCQTTLEIIYRHGYGIEKDSKKSDSLYSILENDSSLGDFYKENRNDKKEIDEF